MEKIELVEKLREKTGLSTEEAWNALERNNWVLVDAMLWLEKEKRIPSQTATASSAGENPYQPVKPTVDDKKSDDSLSAKLRRLLEDSLTHHLVLRRMGNPVLRLPVLVLVVLLCAAFYVVIVGLLAALFCGCQFAMEGPKSRPEDEINQVMKDAEKMAARMRDDKKD